MNRARRVLILMEDLGGGTGNHLCRMLDRWRACNWSVTIVTQTPPQVRRLPADIDVRVTARAGWYDRFPLAQVRRFFELRRIVRAVQPDVVHTYFFWSLMYGRLLKLLGAIRHLVENREDTGFSWGRGSYAALRLTRGIPDRIICVAQAVRGVALDREGVRPDHTLVIHNGIALGSGGTPPVERQDARRRFGFADTDVVVGMVANLPRAVKGGRRLLDAVRAIVGAAPHVRFLLVGVGTDRATLAPELEARGIAAYVVGAGYRNDVETCYAAMDVSVLTSSTEGLSITLLESMRHGLPTVVTQVGGNPELVVDGVTGFLVPVDDPAAFIDRVVALARDAQLRAAMGAAGRRRVAEHFLLETVADRYLAVYDELLATAPLGATARIPAGTAAPGAVESSR
jgi:glycosyltransferase involved in cell wall biosynthesis